MSLENSSLKISMKRRS